MPDETDKTETAGTPVEVMDIEDAELEATQPEVAAGARRFFFAHVGVIKLSDTEKFHVTKHHMTVTEPEIIKQLLKLSENPNQRIFPQD